jgi:hypothetical protein
MPFWTRKGPAEDDWRALKRRVDDMEADVRRLQAEWVDMYDKLVRRDERLRKREERAGAQETLPLDQKASLWARARSQPHLKGRS